MKITKSKLKQLIKEEARKPFKPYQPDQADHDIDTYGTRDNLEPYREMAAAALAIPRGIDVHGELEDQLNSMGLASRGARLGRPYEEFYDELDMGNLINQFGDAVAPKVDALIRLMAVAEKDPQGRAMLDAVYDERPDLELGFKQSQGVLNTPEKRRGVEEFSESKVKITKNKLKQLIKEELEALNERMPALGKVAGKMAADQRRRKEAADNMFMRGPAQPTLNAVASDLLALEERVRTLENLMAQLMDSGEVNF